MPNLDTEAGGGIPPCLGQREMKVKALEVFRLDGAWKNRAQIGQVYDLPERRANQLMRIGAAEAVDTAVKKKKSSKKKKVAKRNPDA